MVVWVPMAVLLILIAPSPALLLLLNLLPLIFPPMRQQKMIAKLTNRTGKIQGPRNPPMKTQSMRLLRTMTNMRGKTRKKTIGRAGLGSAASCDLCMKYPRDAPQASERSDKTMLTCCITEACPVERMMMSWRVA